jgi:hypothetical protein
MTNAPENQDARTLSIVQSSGLVRFLDRIIASVTAAWRDSIASRIVPQRCDPEVAGSVTVIASVTTIVLQRYATRPAPWTWIVPACFLFGGLCLIAWSRARNLRRR